MKSEGYAEICDIEHRYELAEVMASRGYSLGVEIGVLAGGYSRHLLSSMPALTLYSVDPWRRLGGEPMERQLILAMNNLREFGDRSVLIVATSMQALRMFADESLDFVYIDGDHTYEGATLDMQWFRKVRPGGLFCGDDYHHAATGISKHAAGKERFEMPHGVIRAVDEFARNNRLKLLATKRQSKHFCRQWMIER